MRSLQARGEMKDCGIAWSGMVKCLVARQGWTTQRGGNYVAQDRVYQIHFVATRSIFLVLDCHLCEQPMTQIPASIPTKVALSRMRTSVDFRPRAALQAMTTYKPHYTPFIDKVVTTWPAAQEYLINRCSTAATRRVLLPLMRTIQEHCPCS